MVVLEGQVVSYERGSPVPSQCKTRAIQSTLQGVLWGFPANERAVDWPSLFFLIFLLRFWPFFLVLIVLSPPAGFYERGLLWGHGWEAGERAID